MLDFAASLRQQQDAHYRISRIVENLKKLGRDKITLSTIDSRIQLLEENWRNCQRTHQELITLRTEAEAEHGYFKEDFFAQCEDVYLGVKDALTQYREQLSAPLKVRTQPEAATNPLTSRNAITRALPKISIPKFSGDYASWPPFRDLFSSMIIENDDILAVEKLHYLKSNVSGDASRLIANFAVTANNFTLAWEALVSRYDNRRVLITSYLDQIFTLGLIATKSSSKLKELLSTVKESLGGLRMLDAPVDSWDLFIVHFMTTRLDSESREAWELDQGGSSNPASFKQLEAFLEPSRSSELAPIQSRSDQANRLRRQLART